MPDNLITVSDIPAVVRAAGVSNEAHSLPTSSKLSGKTIGVRGHLKVFKPAVWSRTTIRRRRMTLHEHRRRREHQDMATINRFVAIGYGVLSYLVFLAALGYAVGFAGGIAVPHSVDHGFAASTGYAVGVDVLLLTLFAVQHMARSAFKKCWTRLVPQPIERSTYVLLTSAVLFLLYWQWRPIPAIVWDVPLPVAHLGLWALFWLGWMIVLAGSFMINHFELFGLQQVYRVGRAELRPITDFRMPLLYRLVRHPLMLGFIIAFWAAPTMTAGHLLFAFGTTGYIAIGVQFEERDLLATLGAPYRDYRRKVPMLVPAAKLKSNHRKR
jgi:protein-S-isoprenylcysteine O-methyltransferase Ste14